ncbi:hypothetical protein [Elizabethkingia meningoseptica]|uniref:hypothetical protein n=1 Tax=Elizabethkingia meningoseptica TaxID=238 RepID=UPI0016237E95|nr:hypothetical protein [Elizabethkingia meningoseptica]
MNPEELYLQYQSNGGNLSLEDFLNMQSYLEPNDFSALIQDTTSLKKKEDTNPGLLSSQGLSTSNNGENINPISGGQNMPQEILSVPIDSQLDLNQNQLDQQNGVSNLVNSNSESALTYGNNGTPFTTNLPVNTQNPLSYKGNMDNLVLDENGNAKSKVGNISFPNDNPSNNTTTFNSGVTVPNIYLPDETKVDYTQLPKSYLSPRQYKPGELLDYSYQDFTGANINDPESYAKDLESKGYIRPSYLKDGTRVTLENGLSAFEITKNGAEYFTKESEKYVEGNNYEAAKQKLSPDKSKLTDLEKYTNSLFDKYGYLVTEEDRSNYLQTSEGRKELQITLETQQELGSYPNATYQQVYDMVSRRYNKSDEFYLDKAQSVLVAMMDNQKQTAFDDFSNRFGSDNEIMPDDVAENKFYLEVEKNYDLKKLFGEFLDSEEGQLYTRTDQSIRNNTNGQRNRKNIWNAFSNWTNKKELLDIEAKQNNISNLKYNVQSAAESGDFNLVNQYVNQINSVQNSIQDNIKNVQQNDSITSDVNKIFTRVNKEDSEAQDFQARVLSGDGIARTQNILGQVVLGLGQSAMDASSGILRILTTPFSQNVKDSVDQLNEPLKLGTIEISPLRTNVTKYSDNSGRTYEERNGTLFQVENGIYKPVSNISGLKETGKDSEYNPSGMAFLTGKMAGDILITNEVGGLINNTITNNAISLASKTTQAFGAESEIAKQARNFARYAQSANSVENKSVSGWFVQMYNDSYKSAEDSGISSTAGKTVYATVNSFIQSLIQRINPDSKFLSGFNNEYKQLLSSLSTSNGERILANAKSLFSKIGDNIFGETKEELIQQVVGDITNYVTNVISGSDFKLTDSEGYKDVVVGTIVPSAIASLMGGSGSRNIKLGNNEINLSNYNRSQLLTELSRFDGANNMLKVMSNDSSFDSYSNTLDDVKNEILTRQKYINKIPDSQNYSTDSLDSAIKVLQQLETKRNDLNQADAAFKPRIESEISSLESEVDQILNQKSTNENTTSTEQTSEGTQGQEATVDQTNQDAFPRSEPTGNNSSPSYLIKDKSLIEKLQKAGVEEKVIQALPENFRINEKWLMGDKGESLLSRIMKSALIAGQNYSVVERDNNDQILNYDTGRVDINKLAKFFGKDVLYHETVHAATVLTMEDMRINPQNYTEEEMAAHDNLYSEIKRLNQLKKSGNKANPKGASLYGLSNQYEFVAEFMSNNKFREWVGTISNESSDTESNNLLQKIWNNIKSMLGLNTIKPNIDSEYLNNIQNNIDVILNKQRETNETQSNQQNDIRQNLQQPEQQSSFNENASVESTNSPIETIRQNENAQTSNVSEEVNFDDLLARVNKIFNDQTRSSTNSNEGIQSAPNINQEQQISNSETVQTNELPGSANQVEVGQNDLRSQESSISNDLNPNQTRLSENVIATTKQIRLPDGDNGYRVTITDNNGNLIEDRNGDSEFDFSDQSEVDKFINQKQRGFSLSKQPKIKTEVPVTESTPSTNYVGKRVSFNQFGDTRSGVVESENKGRLTIKGDDGKTYFTGSPLVQNLKDESGNPIQLQRSSENFTPISKEAFDSLIEKLKKPFAKAFKNLNITTDWNEFLNKSKSLGLNLNFDAKFSVNDNTRKEKQLELINKKNPAPNNYSTWIRTTNDILTADEAFKEAFQDGEMYPDFTVEDMEDVLDSGEVTVYSSYPIKEGVFVTPSKMNAESYSGDGKVYSKKVNASDLAWIDQGEGQYAPVKFMRNNNGTIYGAKLPDGTIYINPEYLNANTPIHEFSHLWEQLMPSRFKKGVELLKQTKTGKEIFNRLKSEGNYNNLSDNELWNEALNTHIGNYGEWQFQERQARGKMAEFVQWFRAFFNKIGDVLGIGNINPNISLNNFTNKVLGDLMNEKILSSENSNSANINYSLGSNELNNIAESTKRHIKEYSTYLKNKEKLKNGELTNENTIRIVNESRFNDENYTIDLGRPSNLLKSIGVSDNEMNVNLSYLFNKIIKQSKHEISDIQNLRNIVDNIQAPVAVFDNYEDGKKTRDRLEFLTSLKNSNNKNIALILSLNEENSSNKINTIKTGFALNNINRLRARLLNNYDGIKYINKKGIIDVLRDNINVGDSNVKIRYDKNTDSIKLTTDNTNSTNVKFLKETIDLINGFKNPNINNVNFSIRTDNTNKLKIKDDVELSNFFGDNTTSIDELISKGYNVSDDIANLARKFGTKIYVINENLFNKSENEINSYVDGLMKDYQILIDNGTYKESYLRQELLDGIINQVFNDALGEAKGNSIYIKEGATDLNNFLKTKLVQHELAHVFTSYYLADNIDSSQLNEQELTFRNQARSAYEEALKNPNKTNEYGYSNTYEFIAEYIANENFKSEVDNYLDSLNNPEPKSLLTRIIDYIKGLFGIKNNTELKQEFQLQKSIDEHINRLKNADGSINLQAYSGVRFMIKKLMPVSTIQEVLNETETNGIEAGLAKFKESAFYNSLSDKQKALIESEGITKLMQEQVILHREDQINKKKTAIEKAKEQTSKKEKEIALNKIEKIHENYKNKIEELRKSNKSYREKVAERKRQAKEAYDNTVIFLNQNMISGKITPTEVSRLLKAATGILSTRNSISNFNKFTELFNKINAKAEERNKTQIERTTDKYNEVSQTVEQQFNSGKSLQEIKDSFNSIDEQRMVESAYNRLANKTISPEEARKKLDDSYKSSKEVLTKRFKDENGNIMSFNQKFRAWLKNKVERRIVTGVDRQFIPKRILENIGAKAVSNRMIAYAGSSTIAKEKFDKVQKNVYDGLNRSELELLDKIIAAKRFIAIDQNREEKGLPVVDHPGYQDSSTAQKALDAYKSEIGEDAFTKLNKRADAYFDAFKDILSDMRESGLISNEVYEELKDIDYQPRKFLRYILDADGELMSSDRTMFRNENGNLSKEQIIGLSEGDASDMLMDSKWLIQSALASRYKAIGMNEINRTFFTKYFPDAKAKFESINPDNIPVDDKKFYKYFKQLQSNIKENRIIGFTESGKPKYESTTPEGYKIAYYYENGVRHQVFMKEEFHKMWHDTMDKLINSDLAHTISTLSGSRLLKAFATGNNPGFVFTNTPRDFVHALLFSPEYSSFLLRSGAQLTKDSIKAIGEIYKHRNSNKTTLLTKYLEYGGGMEWLNQQGEIKDLTSLNKTIGNYFDSRIDPKSKKILSTLFDFARLKSLSNYSETMFRVAVFDRSLQNQLKEYNKLNNTSYKSVEELSNEDKNNIYYEAVASSRGLLDFNQGGTFTKSAEAVIPYLNAATQGTRVMVEAIKRNPISTAVRFIQAAGFPVLGMHLMMNFIMGLIRPPEKEDEPVNKSYADFLDGISPAQKMNYWNIPVGWDKEENQWKVLRIAKAQQLTPISILFENAYEDYIRGTVGMTKRGSIRNTWKNFANALGDNIDPTHLASALEDPSKSQSYFDAAFKLIGSNPASKGLTQYYTGYDTFREQPLSFDIGKVSRKYEGADKANVEEFYKELGKALDDSPVRLKSLVESIITSPQTNPFVGIMYGGADAIVTDVDAKNRAGIIYNSFIKRILTETSDFNRQLNKKALVQEQLDKNTDEYGETRNKAKQILNKYGSVNELLKNEKSLIEDIEGYSNDPVIQKDLVNRIKSLVKKDGISSMVFDVKYGTNNNVKNKALLIYTYAEGMSSSESIRFIQQLESQKLLTKPVIIELKKLIKLNNNNPFKAISNKLN